MCDCDCACCEDCDERDDEPVGEWQGPVMPPMYGPRTKWQAQVDDRFAELAASINRRLYRGDIDEAEARMESYAGLAAWIPSSERLFCIDETLSPAGVN